MYLLAKFGGNRSYGNGVVNSFIISYLSNLEKVQRFDHILRFSKSGILVYHFKVPRKAGKKAIKTRTA